MLWCTWTQRLNRARLSERFHAQLRKGDIQHVGGRAERVMPLLLLSRDIIEHLSTARQKRPNSCHILSCAANVHWPFCNFYAPTVQINGRAATGLITLNPFGFGCIWQRKGASLSVGLLLKRQSKPSSRAVKRLKYNIKVSNCIGTDIDTNSSTLQIDFYICAGQTLHGWIFSSFWSKEMLNATPIQWQSQKDYNKRKHGRWIEGTVGSVTEHLRSQQVLH